MIYWHVRRTKPFSVLSLLGVGLFLLQGCATSPTTQRPTIELPQKFDGMDSVWQVFAAPTTTQPSWWQALGDPVLSAFQEAVARDNLSLQQAELAYRQANVLAEAAPLALWPTLSLGSNATRKRNSDGTSTLSSSLLASSHWEIDLWGKVRAQYASTLQDVAIQKAAQESAKLSIQTTLATAMIRLRALDQRLSNTQQQLSLYERRVVLLRQREAMGVISVLEIFPIEKGWHDLQKEYEGLQSQRQQLEQMMAVLLGRFPEGFHIKAETTLNLKLPQMVQQVPATLLERRWDIKQAEAKVARANADQGYAAAAYFPSLSFDSSIGQQGGWGKWLSAPQLVWSLGPSLALAILDSGKRHVQTEQARLSYESAVLAYRETVLEAFKEVETVLSDIHVLTQQAYKQEQNLTLANKNVSAVVLQKKMGVVGELSVLEAQINVLNEASAMQDIYAQRLMSYVQWMNTLGGGI